MLTQVDFKNPRGITLVLPMDEDEAGSYQVVDIEGLDPGKAVLVSRGSAGSDGEQFQSAKRPPRNIKVKLEFDPDFAPKGYTELRNDLYTWFMPKSSVSMRYHLDTGLYLDIDGFVESCDSPMFEQDPDATISIMCYKPDFIDTNIVSLDGNTVSDDTNTVIAYPGTVEAGTVVTLNCNRDVTSFSIYNQDEGGNDYQLDFDEPLLNGDQLVISSLRGNKGITRTRSGVSSSLLYGRSAQSSWINLFEGNNNFRVYAEGDPVPYTLEYVVRYGGL
jgi:hypothetical protein